MSKPPLPLRSSARRHKHPSNNNRPNLPPEPRTTPPQRPHFSHHCSHNNLVVGCSAAVGNSCPAVVESIALDNFVMDGPLVAGSKAAAAAGIVHYMDPLVCRQEEGRWVVERHSVLVLALPSILDCVCGAGKRGADPSWRHPYSRWWTSGETGMRWRRVRGRRWFIKRPRSAFRI